MMVRKSWWKFDLLTAECKIIHDGDNALATMNVSDGAAVGYGGRQLGHGDVDGGVIMSV